MIDSKSADSCFSFIITGFRVPVRSCKLSSGQREDCTSPICALRKLIHTDTGLSDSAADRVRQFPVQQRLLERKLCAVLASGKL